MQLESTGLLSTIAQDISQRDFRALIDLFSSSGLTQTFVAYALGALVLAVLVAVLTSGFVTAAEYGSYWKAIGGSRVDIASVLASFVDRWKPMAWTLFLSYSLTFLPIIGAFLLTIFAVVFLEGSLVLLGAVIMTYLAAVVATAFISLFFIYTPVAVVSDNVSGFEAIRKSVRQVRKAKKTAATYGFVYIFLTTLVGATPSLIPGIGLPLASLATVGLLIIVVPILHLTKTSLYEELVRPSMPSDSLLTLYKPFLPDLVGQFPKYGWQVFRRGLAELRSYALNARNFPYHLASAASLVVGWLLGFRIAQNGLSQAIYSLGYVPGRINPELGQIVPLSLGTYIFLHNWQVSLATGLSGIWFSLSPVTSLLMNGVILGIISDLVPNTALLLSGLLPHGIIEIPSFMLAGSAGIKLGVMFLRSRRNPEEGLKFEQAFRQTLYLLFGLALLFFIAGMIEGTVTPQVMRLAGWS
ncbi:MAG: stage II sporulation protein M [Thaumarchaeota archaeon]|nr:stage II sporulation protein M [Nitrososphaerota archaeon]